MSKFVVPSLIILFMPAIWLLAPAYQVVADPPRGGRQHVAHQVVRITDKDAGNPAEVSLAVNPTKVDQLVAASFTTRGSRVYSSEDGGQTWKASLFPNPLRRQQGDDVLYYDGDGNLFHVCIRFQGIRQRRPRAASTGIFLTPWIAETNKWGETVPVVDHVNSVEPFEDKPWIARDAQADSKHRGNIYVAWTRFDVYGSKNPEHKSHLFLARSTDGGKSFSPCQRISDIAGDCQDSSNTLMGGMPAVGVNGEVFVVWSGPAGIVCDSSTDGGATFGQDVLVAKNPGGWDISLDGIQRSNGLPIIQVDTSKGPNRGSIYVTWIDKRNNDPDVFCSASRDSGKTWSAPIRINNDEVGNSKDQIFHWTALDPVDGSLNVIFYDRRDLEGTKTGLTLARSIDGGKTFTNFAIDQDPFQCFEGVFFGDYIGITAQQGRVVGAYSHFVGRRELALSAALFHFKPGTMETIAQPK